MATPAQIRTALATAQSNRLSYADKADLLDHAIDQALVDGSGSIGLPWTATGADGVTVSRMTIDQAVALAARLRRLDSGGIVSQLTEFPDVEL